MSQLPAQPSTVRTLTRFNRGLEVSATPRLVLGSGLALYGSVASAYVAMLVTGMVANWGTLGFGQVLFVAVVAVFGVGPLLAGLLLLAAGVARYRGVHPLAQAIERRGFQAVAVVTVALLALPFLL